MISMKIQTIRWYIHLQRWPYLLLEVLLAVSLVLIYIANPVSAAMRLQERSLYMNSAVAGETTFYRISFRYMSPNPVGSVEMLFCEDPIPYHPCEVPPGFDVSGAELTEQAVETGFSLSAQTQNRLVISRSPAAPSGEKASYTFDNIVNQSDPDKPLSIRLKTLGSIDGTGPQIDFGSIRGQVTPSVDIATQVPPILIFCMAELVEYNCTNTNDVYYNDMGELSSNSTLSANSQMAVGTNASAGFVITANGPLPAAGTSTIDAIDTPSSSQLGRNQFGINLVANTQPGIGLDPEGEWANAVVHPDYSIPNMYKFKSGDTVAYSPNVSLMKKFTVSYVLNSSPDLRAGVYTTSINFIASGRF